MPSPRRVRLLILAVVGSCIFFFFYGTGSSGSSELDGGKFQDFYHKTVKAMDGGKKAGQAIFNAETGEKAGHIPADRDGDGDIDEDDVESTAKMSERLKAAEQVAKNKANEKAGARPDPPSMVVGMGSSREGQEKLENDGVSEGKGKAVEGKEKAVAQDAEVVDAGIELEKILKKAPVIIFSKSYCPYSKRAKGVLLEKYHIEPDPYVVELDKHPLGSALQDQLELKTGRRTVPNIMINQNSIGGADDIIALDREGKLIDTVQTYGQKKVEITERFTSEKPAA